MTWSLIPTPCRLRSGERLALLRVPSDAGAGFAANPESASAGGAAAVEAIQARLRGPGLPADGVDPASLAAWNCYRLVPLPEQPGRWTLVHAGRTHDLAIDAWPALLTSAHLVHFGHSDFGWADLPDRMRAGFVQDLDLAIRTCEATAHLPEGERFTWNVEVSALVEDWLAARRPADHARLAALVAAGRIEIGAFSSNVVLPPCDPEELFRLCDPALRLAARLGGSVQAAHHIDIPGLHPRLAAAMRATGVRYLTWGANAQYSLDHDGWIPRCFRWRPDGVNEIQVWRHTQDPHLGSYAAGGRILGALDQSPQAAGLALALLLSQGTDPQLPVALVSLGADFCRPVPAACALVAWWNRTFASPQIRLSTNSEAHRDIAATTAGRLPVITGQFPDAWITLGLGVPDLTALARRTALGLRRAEQVALWRGLAGAGTSTLDHDRISAAVIRQHEHTYGLEGFCDRYHARTLDDIRQSSGPIRHADEDLRTAAWQDLTALTRRFAGHDADAGPLLVVLNHLPRLTTAVTTARIHIRHLRHRKGFQVRDLVTGRIVPHQTEPELKDRANYHQTTTWHLFDLHFLASDVPALGYRLFRLEAVDDAAIAEPMATWTAKPGGHPAARLDWAHGSLDIDQATGAIRAWRRNGRDLLPAADRPDTALLGECRLSGLATTCAKPKDFTDNDRFYQTTEVFRPRLQTLTPCSGGPVFAGWTASATLGRLAKLELQVRAFAHAPDLQLDLFVERLDTLDVESLALAVPAALTNPRFAHDGGGLTIDPINELAPGAFRDLHVADRWAAMHGAEGALVVASPEAPVVSFGGQHLLHWHRAWPADLAAELWVNLSLNGHWKCGNVTRRNRESGHWRLTISPQSTFDHAAAQHLGDLTAFPLTATLVESGDADPAFTAAEGNLIRLDENGRSPEGIQVISLRPSANGLSLRLAERAGRDHRLRLEILGHRIRSVDGATLEGSVVRIDLAANQVAKISVDLG